MSFNTATSTEIDTRESPAVDGRDAMSRPSHKSHAALRDAFFATRQASIDICSTLEIEDYGLQAAAFASPPKWHLAHTSWFFETFLLKVYEPAYVTPDAQYEVLFNSYYNGIGEQHPRDKRGLLSRPTVAEVIAYREHVNCAMAVLLQEHNHKEYPLILERTRLGIEHEKQHQELLLTDLKYSLAANPLFPAYKTPGSLPSAPGGEMFGAPTWETFAGGLVEVGHTGNSFAFDNELPRHKTYLQPFELCTHLVSNAAYQAFIDDGAYDRPELWLADGWAQVQAENWRAPLHWHERDGQAMVFTLEGLKPRLPDSPVCHVSGYEADAYARWAEARLPTEAEWEHAASSSDAAKNLHRLYGSRWQWTQTAYGPYPGFRAASNAIGEYNGKFMSNQWVLRGSSFATAQSQSRSCYRNFFYPQDRWQFSGIRLAR